MTDLLLSILATWRVSAMVANETGPGHLFVRLRTWPESENLREGLACERCLGVWLGAVCALYLALCGRLPWRMVPLAWLGISGGGVLLGNRNKHD